MCANRLVHIPKFGDFQVRRIISAPLKHQSINVLQEADPEMRENLVAENELDPLDAEQTWPTDQELMDAEQRVADGMHERDETPFDMMDEDKLDVPSTESVDNGPMDLTRISGARAPPAPGMKRVPRGTSSYQAAWIVEEVQESDAEDMDEDASEEEMELAPISDNESVEAMSDIELDVRSVKFDALDEDQEREQLEAYNRQKESRDHTEFPDEIDTPQHIPASVRFARYRGLKSFRTSPWDPYENLPDDYGRIFQFQNFRRSKKRVMDSLSESGVEAGTRVTIEIINVPSNILDTHDASQLLTVYGLLPYEHKVSVVNFVVTRTGSYTEPIKSKDAMILMCGFRQYVVHPLYSTYTRGGANNVHKFERYLQPGKPTVATIYAPIQFGPTPVLMFKYSPSTHWDSGQINLTLGSDLTPLIATGTILDLDPLRITARRLILTGHPFKVHKRGAVIRYMFFSPADIDYFRPIQITTKLGRTGHIKESLGTHGYMKCVFDAGIKQHDTIMMCLYKRVFPKFTTRMWGADIEEVSDEIVDVEMQ